MKTEIEGQYKTATSPIEYTTETIEFQVNQGEKDSKVKVSIRMHEAPREEEFPGGKEWIDDDGKPTRNPFYMSWLKYEKDHGIAGQRRNGETVFTTLWKPIPAERGEMVRKPATVAKELESAMERDSEGMMKAMALRLMSRKGITYEDAIAKVREDWA